MSGLPTSRRKFLKQAALVSGFPMIIPSSVLGSNGKTAPSNRIVLGGIGLGRRGRLVLKRFLDNPDCQFIATADPQKERRGIIKRMVDRHYGNEDCILYDTMEGLLDRKDIDAVIIATGDRWHTTASIVAARAGKDIYCEKPCAMNIQECRELDEAILKYDRIFQAGTQRRNVDNFMLAAEIAHSGKLGKLTSVHAGILRLKVFPPPLPAEPEPDPAEINWDRWLGPAPWLEFNRKYCQGQWDNTEGLSAANYLPAWGSHTVDLCQWAAECDDTVPVEYEAEGTTVRARYANGVNLIMRLSGFKDEGNWIKGLGSCPVRFEGEDGWVEVGDFKRIEVSNPKWLEGKSYDALAGTDPARHVREFLDSVKSRKKTACHSTVTRKAHIACCAAALSWRLGRKLEFDPATETFTQDQEANQLSRYTRRAPYTI
jgi:predicted dehydrogenase